MGPRHALPRPGTRGASLLLGLLGLLAACGGGDPAGPATEAVPSPTSTAAAAAPPVEALLDVIDTNVAVRPGDTEAFDDAADGHALVAGDTVRTDERGFGEVQYADGSLTRLDVDSEVTVVTLDEAVDSVDVTVSLDAGRVWNRARSIDDATGRFEVGTDVGTAAVRGTAFEVDCRRSRDGSCLFAVYEGTVEVTPDAGGPVTLGPFEYVVVLADGTVGEQGTIETTLAGPDAVDADWVRRNVELDEAGGAPPIDGLEPEPGPLALGAIHDCGSDAPGATQYYRFFADGEVISVTSTGTPEQVDEWFVAGYEDSGTYTVDGDRIRGSTTWEDVTVEFDGTVADDGTVTMTTRSTNGHVDEITCTPLG